MTKVMIEVVNMNEQELRKLPRDMVLKMMGVLQSWKSEDDKDTVYRTQIETMSSDRGCKSVNDFLTRLGYIKDPSVKKPRKAIPKDVLPKIVEDLKLGTMTTKEISDKYGITTDSVYNIKGRFHLTKTREKLVLTTTVETQDGTVIVPETPPTVHPTDGVQPSLSVTVSPTTAPTPMVSETPSVVTPTVQFPELKKEVA